MTTSLLKPWNKQGAIGLIQSILIPNDAFAMTSTGGGKGRADWQSSDNPM